MLSYVSLAFTFSFVYYHFVLLLSFFFFFNDTATTEIYTLSLHDALPISCRAAARGRLTCSPAPSPAVAFEERLPPLVRCTARSEEHTSELQSRQYLVCRLLLEKKKNKQPTP